MLTKIFGAKAQDGEVSITDSITDEGLGKASDGVSGKASDGVSGKASDKVSGKASGKACVKVSNVDILSRGKAASKGILIVSEGKKVYIALPMDSISKILDLIGSVIETIVSDVPTTIPYGGGVVGAKLSVDMKSVSEQIKQLKANLQ